MTRTHSTVVAAVLASAAAIAHGAEGSFEQRVAANAAGVVEISNVAGSVQIAGWDRAEVEVKARYDADVDRVEVTSNGGRTRIRVVVPRGRNSRSDADLRIRVPRASGLEVSTVSANVTARDVTGEQRVKTVSGNVKSEFAAHDVEVKTVSGDLWVRGKSEPASVRLSTVSGNVRLDRGAGEVDAVTVSGNLDLDVSPARSVRVRTTSGGLEFRGKLARGASFDAETISGDLSVRAPAEDGIEFEISSFSGDIDNCFNLTAERTSRHGPGHRLSGKRGDGSAKIRMRTMSGSVDLCDR